MMLKRFLLLAFISSVSLVVMFTFSPKIARASGGCSGLSGVAAISDDNVWAVGQFFSSGICHVLIEHWDGTTWQIVPSPDVAGAQTNVLAGVAAVSDHDIWAVGNFYIVGSVTQPLIEHWDGAKWQIVPSPTLPGGAGGSLQAVAAVSTNNVWAVGGAFGTPDGTLIEHWDGRTWSVVASPDPGLQGNILNGVAAVSNKNAWAVGDFSDASSIGHVLIEHWNGHIWSTVTSPDPGPQNNNLLGVAATSAHDVWAVGYFSDSNNANQAFVEHWNGHSWQIMTGLNPAGSNNADLSSVAAISGNDVWAVGAAIDASGDFLTLIEHWDGSTWQIVSSPNESGTTFDALFGVAAVPHDEDVWAVGDLFGSQTNLIEAWDGSAWNIVPNPAP